MHKLFYDGACNPNPGPVGIGAVLVAPDGRELAAIARRGQNGTNNTAEYDALIAGLELAISHGISDLTAYGDSKLITMQSKGEWDCNHETLNQRLQAVNALAKRFRTLKFEWVRREKNIRADELSKEGISKPLESHNDDKPKHKHQHANYKVKAFPGVGMAVSDGVSLFAINFHPLQCSCGQPDNCEHILFLKQQLSKRGDFHGSN